MQRGIFFTKRDMDNSYSIQIQGRGFTMAKIIIRTHDGKEQNRPENILIKRNGQNEEFYKMLEEVWQNMHNNVTNMEDVYENKH